jgi:hypothetical protein
MMQISGSLQGVGLLPLLRFLGPLPTPTRLRMVADPWSGEATLAGGRVVAATFGQERGLVALEAMLLTLAGGTFEVGEATPPAAPDEPLATMSLDDVTAHLEQVSREYADATAVLLSPTTVFSATELPATEGETGDEFTMTRRALAVLLAIQDGRQSLVRLADRWGLYPAIQAILELSRLGLIQIELPPEAPPGGQQRVLG